MLTLSSFRGRLALWFGGLSLLTLLCVGLYVGRLATKQIAVTAGESVHATALAAANLLAANLRERELEITLLSQAPHFVRGDLSNPDILQSLELRKKFRSEFAWLGVADAEGTVIQASGGMLQGQSVGKRPWYIAARQGVYTGDVHEAVLLAKLLPSQASGEPLRFIDFAAPIKNKDGQTVGVIGAHGHWRWVTDTVQAAADRLGSESRSDILILDKQGAVLYPQSLVGPSSLPDGIPTRQPYATVVWGDGQAYLTSQVAVDARTQNDLGWRIVVRQPLETALQPLYALRNRLIVLGFFATLLFALVALRLARSVSQPIEQLAAAARQIERREAAPRYPEATDVREVAQLSQSMQSMTQSLLQREHELETLNQTLEQQVQQRTAALEAANQQLEQLATRDALTGLYNRRCFDEKLKDSVHTSQRSGRSFALLVLDADHFKRINDTYGHNTGDVVLQQLARLLTEHTRNTDFVARYGGEEFVVLLPDIPHAEEATTVAEKVRAAVEQASFPDVGRLTVSIGISLWTPDAPHGKALFQHADEALYQAKSSGRNRVMVYAPK
ncbi:MAG: diguanylate cyclase [Pseudomonadota bacterium]